MAWTSITLVDQPDKGITPESQRVYKLADTASYTQHFETVRIRRDPDAYHKYVVENLVRGQWHVLLDGFCDEREVPFDDAIARAAAVLA